MVNEQEFKKIAEAVAVLAGWRGNKSKMAMVRSDLGGLEEYIAKLSKDAGKIEKSLGTVNEGLQQTQSDLSTLQDGLSAVQTGLSAANGVLADLENQIAAAQDQIDAIAEGSSTAQQDIDNLKLAVAGVSVPGATGSTVTAPPTDAEFNALVNLVNSIATSLAALKTAAS